MQQTEHYELNIIEPSDEMSPEPLNENARKVAAELFRQAPVIGTYRGDGTAPREIDIGFRPKVLVLIGPCSSTNSLTVLGEGVRWSTGALVSYLSLTDRGFKTDISLDHNDDKSDQWYLALR